MDKKERLIIGLVSIEGTQGETIIEVSSIYPPTMKLAFLISLCSYLFLLSQVHNLV